MSVIGVEAVVSKLSDLPELARRGIGKALAKSVTILDAHGKEKISRGSPSGRAYKRGKQGKVHIASAPGQFPATDRGQLVASLFFRVQNDGLAAFWGTKLNYGYFLEFGTTRMAARPWLRPTFEANKSAIEKIIMDAVREAMRG